ncbi:MAG: glycosyltransferase [Candidatus Marinimicrobia bacterium]|nr:glycosyltransferase [Candidatus Neomarinimicrobiota bacterium]
MNILYGVQTTGNGHIGKSRYIVQELKRRGHDIKVIFSGAQQKNIPYAEVFEPYKIFKGLTYATENGKINYIKTAPRLDAFSYVRDIVTYNAKGIDLVITDYEPVSVQIAKKNRIPSIGLSHQYAFQHDVPYPQLHIMIRAIMEYFVPADFVVSVHWHHFGFPILPPIFPPTHIEPQDTPERKCVVVYLPYENPNNVVKMLKECPSEYDYFFFSDVNKRLQNDNIHILEKNRQNFLNHLSYSEGAILHAGFLANSEAFDLGVKTLAKPIAGQAEQIANAMGVEQLGFGKQMQELNPREVWDWLEMPPIKAMHYPDTATRFVDWIEAGIFSTKSLIDMCEELWSQVPIPSVFRS